jgi:phosphatidylglycerophosphatase A
MWQLNLPSISISIVMIVLALAGSIVCVKFAPAAISATGKKDPGEVVVDEVAGQALTFLPAPFLFSNTTSLSQIWAVAFAGFFLFRLFDTIKPWPARRLEKLPAGWGILADDLMAGIFAAIALSAGCKLFISYSNALGGIS